MKYKILHNAYEQKDLEKLMYENPFLFDTIEIDITYFLGQIRIGHIDLAFINLFRQKIEPYLKLAKNYNKTIAFEIKSNDKPILSKIYDLFKDYKELRFLILKPAKNWWYKEKRMNLALEFYDRYKNDLSLVLWSDSTQVYVEPTKKKIIYRILPFL